MSLAVVQTRTILGVQAPKINVEVHLGGGLPSMSIVGLPDAAVREARARVRGALENSGYRFPPRRVTINLAPADLPKDGARFDLAIAIGILMAAGELPADTTTNTLFSAELALSGALRPIHGILPIAAHSQHANEALIVANANAAEAALAHGKIHGAESLAEVIAHLRGSAPLPLISTDSTFVQPHSAVIADLSDVRGQHRARRALELAAAGGHSLLFRGPPGSGKTMLASRLPGLMPAMTTQEALESATIQSIAQGGYDANQWGQRPFRRPHHTTTSTALTGGGAKPRPGEISLAHHGVLFLDELPEFPRAALEALREPLESQVIHITRARHHMTYPANFQLVAAMNPCPCGYRGDQNGLCKCLDHKVRQYCAKLSGPLLDRIDLQVDVARVKAAELENLDVAESSTTVRNRVSRVRSVQMARDGVPAALLDNQALKASCPLSPAAMAVLRRASDQFNLTARAWHRCLRLTRTIADLEGEKTPQPHHVAEAVGYRMNLRLGDL